ncbi:MAG TPA: DUF2298 domain-containing protein, partial [Methanocella sp.]|nr:DUF2298 domain-containing protein [Methanocella sp.]
VIDERGLVCATTHASDLNFHLSIAQRFVEHPQIPPQDPYLPGYNIVYNWFMQVTFGELTLLTGVGLFDVFKIAVSLVAALTFLDTYLLSRTIFKDDLKASIIAGIVYVASSGLSWVYLLYLSLTGQPIDLFKIFIYEWKDIMQLKYDSTALDFFLPQTQTFGLLGLIFVMYFYLLTVGRRSWKFALVTGLALASLIMYHLVTAFPVLVAMGIFFIYLLLRELYASVRDQTDFLSQKNVEYLTIIGLPLLIAFIAGVYQLLLMSDSAGSQISLGHDPDIYITLLFSIGPLIPFALYGMYLARKNDVAWLFRLAKNPGAWRTPPETPQESPGGCGAWLLIIYFILNFLFLNIFEMNLTHNTYRFIMYMAMPVSLFAGLALSRWLFSQVKWKIAIAALAILIMVPSTITIIMFYNDSSYTHATPADVKALEWIRSNTPKDAVFFEEPTHFVRLPLVTGREDAYAGEIYTMQYHNVDRQQEMEAILHMTDKDQLYNTLINDHIDYVFIGSKESGYPFAATIQTIPQLAEVYNQDDVKIYKVNSP